MRAEEAMAETMLASSLNIIDKSVSGDDALVKEDWNIWSSEEE